MVKGAAVKATPLYVTPVTVLPAFPKVLMVTPTTSRRLVPPAVIANGKVIVEDPAAPSNKVADVELSTATWALRPTGMAMNSNMAKCACLRPTERKASRNCPSLFSNFAARTLCFEFRLSRETWWPDSHCAKNILTPLDLRLVRSCQLDP